MVTPLVAARTDGSGPRKEVRGDGSSCKAKTELLKLVVTVSRAELGQLKAYVLSQLDRIGHQVCSRHTPDRGAVPCWCNGARSSSMKTSRERSNNLISAEPASSAAFDRLPGSLTNSRISIDRRRP